MVRNPKLRVCYRCKRKRVEEDFEEIGGDKQLCARCRVLAKSDKQFKCLKCDQPFISFNGYRLCNRCKQINSNCDSDMCHGLLE